MSYDKYNPNIIIDSAREQFQAGDVVGGQRMYQSALLDWVDDAREGSTTTMIDAESLREAIATLWLAYAEYLVEAKQWKSAMEAYEQAVACPVAGEVGRVYLEYARFAEERNKLKTAQDVYLRALVGKGEPGSPHRTGAVQDEQDREVLWSEFLEMMQKTKPELTMAELQEAAQSEHMQETRTTASESKPDNVSSLYDEVDSSDNQPVQKKAKVEEENTHAITGDSVEVEATAFLESLQPANLPHDISGAWIIRDGSDAPSPPHKMLFEPSPPKLSDSSGKQLLGLDLALSLNKRMMEKSGNLLLDVCRALWTLTALKEKEVKATLDFSDETMANEHDNLEKTLEARMAVAGPTAYAVETLNQNDRIEFKNKCIQQRAGILSANAWEMRNLLCVQQCILTKLGVPGFDGPSIEEHILDRHIKVCSYLHSGFFLRKRVGKEAHETMIRKQIEKLENELKERGAQSTAPGPPQQNPKSVRFDTSVSFQQSHVPLPPPPMGVPPPPPPPPPQPYPQNPTYYPGQYPPQYGGYPYQQY